MQLLHIVLFTVVALAGTIKVQLRVEPEGDDNWPRGKTISEKCGCLNWKDTYNKGLVKCGEGRELYTGQDGTFNVLDRVCDNFFTKASFTQCVNLGSGASDTWCYVDKECPALYGGGKLQQVNWKQCGDKSSAKFLHDSLLRDISPKILYDMSKRFDIAFGALVKMSFPSVAPDSKEPVSLSDFEKGVPARVSEHIGKANMSSAPYWIDMNATGAGGLAVLVVGSTVYKVDRRPNPKLIMPDHPGTWESLQCLANCPVPHVARSGLISKGATD